MGEKLYDKEIKDPHEEEAFRLFLIHKGLHKYFSKERENANGRGVYKFMGSKDATVNEEIIEFMEANEAQRAVIEFETPLKC